MSNSNGWIGVDLDRTLAAYSTWVSPTDIGEPIAPMLGRVKAWLGEGVEVRIFTARIWPIALLLPDGKEQVIGDAARPPRYSEARAAATAVQRWCHKHIGTVLPITCVKDYSMLEIWDDRAVQVIPNTGVSIAEQLAELIKLTPPDDVIRVFSELGAKL